jgi:hypothetical protein
MIARKAWPFRGIGLLASGRKVKMFSSENARHCKRRQPEQRNYSRKVRDSLKNFPSESILKNRRRPERPVRRAWRKIHGKVLFLAQTVGNFRDRCLLEFDPARAEPVRVIAKEGDSVGGLRIGFLTEGSQFGTQANGSVLFNPGLGFFNHELPAYSPNDMQFAIVRWRNGETLRLEPGTVTNDFTNNTRFFRVFYP